MNCKIQTICVRTNTRVSFTPPEVMDEDCLKILYYCHKNFTLCQRVVKIRMKEEKNYSKKQMEPDFSKVYFTHVGIDNYVIYGYDDSDCMYKVEIYTSLSLLRKFDIFVGKIPLDSSIAFINQFNDPFVSFFVEALLRQVGRKPPIDAKYDQGIVKAWLSNSGTKRDLIAHSSALKDKKAEFVINLSSNLFSREHRPATRNAASQYTHICLPTPFSDELNAIIFLSSDISKKSDEEYLTHRTSMEKYLRRTDF